MVSLDYSLKRRSEAKIHHENLSSYSGWEKAGLLRAATLHNPAFSQPE
jgi:hypothetical protein